MHEVVTQGCADGLQSPHRFRWANIDAARAIETITRSERSGEGPDLNHLASSGVEP